MTNQITNHMYEKQPIIKDSPPTEDHFHSRMRLATLISFGHIYITGNVYLLWHTYKKQLHSEHTGGADVIS